MIVDRFGDPVKSAFNGPQVAPIRNYGSFYEGTQSNPARVDRPVFATDSRYTVTQWDRLRAMALARWAYANVPFVRGAVDLNARLCVGTGFTCKSLARDKRWAGQADYIVASKFRNIGFTGGESMDELLLHDCRCVDVDGDLGYVMVEDDAGEARLQVIEAHRIRNDQAADPNCLDGVWLDGYGRRAAYNVSIPGAGDTWAQETKRIAAQNFIYLAERNRPDELRSMTNLIHALAPIQDLYEVLAFEMASVKKNSEIGLTIETPTPDRPPLGPPVNIFAGDAVAATNGSGGSLPQPAQAGQYVTREMVYGGGGKVPILVPGEKLTAHDHNRPGSGIEAWAKFIIRGVAVGFGLPFEVLWDPEAIGGANTRMITALLRARLEQRRECLIFPKLARVRFWILARAIKRGELPYDPDMMRVEFQPNFSDITVDAGRESRERRANVQQGLDTFTGYFAEDGKTYADQLLVREGEIDSQCAAALRLTQKYPGLTFSAALARIAMLTPNANEANAGGNASSPTSAHETVQITTDNEGASSRAAHG